MGSPTNYAIDPDHNNIQAAIDAGMCLGAPQPLAENLVGVIVPAGARLERVNVEEHLGRPSRKMGATPLATAASFIAWVNRNKTPETVIFGDENRTTFRAVFNGHEPEPIGNGDKSGPMRASEPGWGDFTASYGCPLSDEWKRWIKHSQHDADTKKGMPHAEFIQFIEDNIIDVTAPESGKLLSMLARFEARRDVKIVSGKRLDNGDVAFAYSEDTVQVKEGQSDLALPSVFTITIPVFQGGTPYIIDANLRFRAGANGLHLWYELVRPHKSLEVAFKAVSMEIATGTDVPMFAT